MKKLTLILSCLLVTAGMLFYACGKDDEDTDGGNEVETTIQNYIDVKDATLKGSDFPSASLDDQIEVIMDHNVIPGGSSIVRVISPIEAAKVIVGIEGQKGYYELPASTIGKEFIYNFVMIVNQAIELGEDGVFHLKVALLDARGNVTQYWENDISLITVGTGNLQISLTFDKDKDIDLHVIEPEIEDDTLSYYDRHIYFGHRTSRNGGQLDLDANAGCSTSEVWAENVTYGDDAFVRPGLYKVYAVIWSNCSLEEATNITLSVFYQGQLIAMQNGVSNPFVSTFPADAPSTGSNLDMEPTLTFVIPDHGQHSTKDFPPAPLTESAMEKMAAE